MDGILISTLKEELSTAERLERKFSKKIRSLPNGSFIVRRRGNKDYGYLTKREEGKVVQEYLGALSEKKIEVYREQSQAKKEYKAKLKSVQEQLKILRRALRVKST